MSEVKITVGADLRETAARIADRMERATAGEHVDPVKEINFPTWEDLVRTMTPKRMELLRALHRQPAASVHALARQLGRDYKNVHADVSALEDAGLIDRDEDGLRVEADALNARIAL